MGKIQLLTAPQEIGAMAGVDINGIPPALPEKRSKRRKERLPSQYDNVPENEHLSTCSLHGSTGDSPDAGRPPPLPLKKRHSKYRNHNYKNIASDTVSIISRSLPHHCQIFPVKKEKKK